MTRHALLERRRIIPHGTRRIDAQSREDLVGCDVLHADDLDAPNAEIR
jgi:hypothetical protein